MLVSIHKNKLLIDFDYNAYVVTALRLLTGREFNKKTKKWTVPLVHVESVYRVLKPFGFEFTQDVLDALKRSVLLTKKLERIKQRVFTDTESKLISLLNVPLYEYQQVGAGFIASAGSSLIGDQPGLGKTIQTLSATRLKDDVKVLIFCPVSMKKTWQEELTKWFPEKTSTIIGGDVKQRHAQWSQDVNYYICNYHLLLRDDKYMKMINWDSILADEATTISNGSSKTTKKLKSLTTKKKIAMTGTPLNNSLKDIWSIMDWLHPGLLGSFRQFTDEYCVKDKFGSVTGFKNVDKLRIIIDKYMIRRLKRDVLHELPEKIPMTIRVDFTHEERKAYETLCNNIDEEISQLNMFDSSNMQTALVKLIRLRQMTSSFELINGTQQSSKLDALHELLQSVIVDDVKGIIFTQSREMAMILMRELKEYNPLLIAGPVSYEQRDINRHLFISDDVHKLLIMTSAGNMGLNLQRASVVIHYDLPWSISALEQREDRAHRHGQTRAVSVYRLVVSDTIDEYVVDVLYNKSELSKRVLGDNTESTYDTTSITKDDIKNILG